MHRPFAEHLYADSLQRLLAEAKHLGVRLAIENQTNEEGLFTTPDDFLGLLATYELDGLGACWDTGHGWISGQPPEVAGCLGTHLVTLHIHDNDGREDQHRLPMRGSVPWSGFADSLVGGGYEGPLMMELVPPEPCSPDAIRDLVRKAVEMHRRLTAPSSPTRVQEPSKSNGRTIIPVNRNPKVS